MGRMSALAAALAHRRLVRESATLRLLRADHVAVAAALLSTHLGTPGTRMPADDLHELLEADLEELRDHFDLGAKSAKAYCDDWRAAGLLVRRPAPESRGETYELSPEAIDGLRILAELDEPRTRRSTASPVETSTSSTSVGHWSGSPRSSSRPATSRRTSLGCGPASKS